MRTGAAFSLAVGLLLCGNVRAVAAVDPAASPAAPMLPLAVANVASPASLVPHGPSSGHTASGYLGIDVRDVSEERIAALHLKDVRGAEIIRVDHDGPAGKMGLREHDIVLQMNGSAIEGEEHLRRLLHDTAPGRSITLVVSRDGQQLSLSGQLVDRDQLDHDAWTQHLSAPQAPASALPSGESQAGGVAAFAQQPPASKYSRSFLGSMLLSPSYTGAMLEMMGPQLADYFGLNGGSGLLVRSVEMDSPAAKAGMRAGDVVTRANSRRLGSVNEWAKLIRESKGHAVTVVILRDHTEHTLSLLPDSKRRSSVLFPHLFNFQTAQVAKL